MDEFPEFVFPEFVFPELLCSHFEDPYHRGQCDRATHGSQVQDSLTQHFILMQLRVSDDGVIEEAWFESQGCVYCEAPASILVQYGESKSIDELMEFDVKSYLMLTELDQIDSELPACHLLPWTALQHALRSDDLEPTQIEYEGGRPKFGGPSLGEES